MTTILVAFEVATDGERDAALALCNLLVMKVPTDGIIESWWMPNNPLADGSDNERVAVFMPVGYSPSSVSFERQNEADKVLSFYKSSPTYMLVRKMMKEDVSYSHEEVMGIATPIGEDQEWGSMLDWVESSIATGLNRVKPSDIEIQTQFRRGWDHGMDDINVSDNDNVWLAKAYDQGRSLRREIENLDPDLPFDELPF